MSLIRAIARQNRPRLLALVALAAIWLVPDAAPAEVTASGVRHARPAAAAAYFATYFGGDDYDDGYALAVGPDGAIYLAGETSSADLPIVGGAQPRYGGQADAYVAKLAPDGSRVIYSTYLGGKLRDYATGIAVGPDGSAYVTGATASPDFPTVNAFQTRPGGTEGGILDVFVAKLEPDGGRLAYSTYLGGRDWEEGYAIAVGADGAAVVAGQTSSSNYPIKGGPGLTRPCAGGLSACPDGVVTKLSPSGADLIWSTHLGGSGLDRAHGVALDGAGRVVVTGQTNSRNFPTERALQGRLAAGSCGAARRDCDDAFATVITADGKDLAWSTFLGGKGDDQGYGVAAGAGGVYVTGATTSADFPTQDAFQPAYAGGLCRSGANDVPCPDAFVAGLALDGQSMAFGSYLGGKDADTGRGVAADGAGWLALTGETASRDFPLVNPLTTRHAKHGGGQWDGFVTSLRADLPSSPIRSTYLAGREDDKGRGIGALGDGDFAVGGVTGGGFPVQSAAQPDYGGGQYDAFAQVLPIVPDAATPTPPDPTASATPTSSPTTHSTPSPPPPGTATPTATPTGTAAGGRPLYLPALRRGG